MTTEAKLKWSLAWKIAVVIFLAGGFYVKVLSLEKDFEAHVKMADIKIQELEEVRRTQAVMVEQLKQIDNTTERIEKKVDKLTERRR